MKLKILLIPSFEKLPSFKVLACSVVELKAIYWAGGGKHPPPPVLIGLNDTLHLLFKNVHRTNHVVQAESTQTCGLHTIYFIVCMMDPKNTTKPIVNVNVGQYVRDHYDTSSKNASLKDKDIVKHLSKKFKTNFDMLLKAPPKY